LNPERKEFLSLRTLPARMLAEEAAWFLGFTAHDIPILVSVGLLKPLGHPPASGVKFFAAAKLQELRNDVTWLARASDAICKHWHAKNARQRQSQLFKRSPQLVHTT